MCLWLLFIRGYLGSIPRTISAPKILWWFFAVASSADQRTLVKDATYITYRAGLAMDQRANLIIAC